MRVLVEGSGGAAGWPEPGCRCASCRRQELAGNVRGRSTILIDDVVRLGVAGAGGTDGLGGTGGGRGGTGGLGSAGENGARGYRVEELEDARRAGELGGWEVTGPDGARLLYPARPGAVPVPPAGAAGYDLAFVDVLGEASQLGLLRARGLLRAPGLAGAVTGAGAGTRTVAAFADHRVTSERELEQRCGFWEVELAGDGDAVSTVRSGEKRSDARRDGPWRVLVLGGARSGKSERAELRLAGEADVTYVAAGGPIAGDSGAGDPEWAARVAVHRARRPAWWRTVETTDLAGALGAAPGPVRPGALLIDGIGSWLAAVMDECGAWDGSAAAAERVAARVAGLIGAWRQTAARVVAVSDETGLGVVPATPAGRRFRDELGRLNQALAAESEETELMVAGRVLPLADP